MRKLFKISAILCSFSFLLVSCNQIDDRVVPVADYAIRTNLGIGSSVEILTAANQNGLYDESSEVSFKVTLTEGYLLNEVKVNDDIVELNSENVYKFTMPSEEVTIRTRTEKDDTPVDTENISTLEGLYDFVDELLAYDEGINQQVYSTTRRDNYSAIDIYATQEGTITQYKDFYVDDFSQYYDEDTSNKYYGIIQRGITTYQNQEAFYQITDYTVDNSSDSVQYIVYDESQKDFVFGVGFAHYYYYNYLPFLSQLLNSEQEGAVFTTNFNKSSLVENGTVNLTTHYYVGDVEAADIEAMREDILTIVDGTIVSATTTSYYGLMQATNFNYQTSTMRFVKGEIGEFSGVRLNPENYDIPQNS